MLLVPVKACQDLCTQAPSHDCLTCDTIMSQSIGGHFTACINITTFRHILWMCKFWKHSSQVKVNESNILLLYFQVEIPTVVYSFTRLSKNSAVHTCALISHSVTTSALKLNLGESLASEHYHSEEVVLSGFFVSDMITPDLPVICIISRKQYFFLCCTVGKADN